MLNYKLIIENIQSKKIEYFRNFEELEKKKFDVILSFHVIEHLPDPINEIKKLRSFLSSKGKIIIEVPHANDFLLSHAKVESFKDFTLWSQHLILHTKDSLFKLLKSVGFKKINIDGIQRYNIANHMNWLINNKSGGHKSYLAKLENRQIKKEYANFLSKLNANDTLITTMINNLYGIYKSYIPILYNFYFFSVIKLLKMNIKKYYVWYLVISFMLLGVGGFYFFLYYHPLLISSYL